ncbi:MAG: FAD-dependent oxidoreductase [Sphingobium sp.]|nr:FAD-dependent oxidoreductase [Sphingobium sp.]
MIGVELESGASLKAKTVILSTGARWRQMGVPGEDAYRNKGVAYCPHCDGPLFKGKRTAVIGGGNSGVEAAIDLAGIVAHVTLIEFDSTVARRRGVAGEAQQPAQCHGHHRFALTTEVLGDGEKVIGLTLQNRETDEENTVDLEGIFVQIGLVPNTEWLKGAILHCRRAARSRSMRAGRPSVPGVFAAGDATTTFPTSRSSSRWGAAQPPRYRPSII